MPQGDNVPLLTQLGEISYTVISGRAQKRTRGAWPPSMPFAAAVAGRLARGQLNFVPRFRGFTARINA
jgi:hypothetical protein